MFNLVLSTVNSENLIVLYLVLLKTLEMSIPMALLSSRFLFQVPQMVQWTQAIS